MGLGCRVWDFGRGIGLRSCSCIGLCTDNEVTGFARLYKV